MNSDYQSCQKHEVAGRSRARWFVLYLATLIFLVTGPAKRLLPATVNHYVYVFPPGFVDVYDMDNGFSLVKSVSLPQTQSQTAIGIRGVVASAATGMLYLSYNSDSCSGGEMLKYDLVHDTVVWTQSYSFGVDSMSISPDGQKIYMPTGELCSGQGVWQVIDANTGNPIGQINSLGAGPHNTITSLNGAHVYMGPRYSNNLVLGDASSLSVIRDIGPVSNGVRPFTINAEETYAFLTTSNDVGFYVGDINSGKILYWVCPPGFCWTSGSFNGISGVSHGVTLSPNEKEIYLIDLPYNHVHAFDVTALPGSAPVDVADIPLNCKLPDEGWLQHSRDGRFVYVGDCGDVIDTSTRKIVANMPGMLNTRIFNEVDFLNGVPSFSPLSRNQGGYGSQPSNINLSSTSLAFGNQTLGTVSNPQSVTLSNSGSAALAITSISLSGSDPGDFAQTNTCGSSVQAGGNCSISVTFNPTAAGTRTASITIADSDPSSPQTVSLSGTGVVPTTTVTVLPTSLTFTSQTVGTSSTAQSVTVSNTGNATLSITSIAITGVNSSDFGETNTCGSSVAAGGNCAINVTFTPMATGTRTASVTITDNAASSPQAVSLTGTGAAATSGNFTLTASTGTITTTGGQSASFTVSVTPTGGFNQDVNLTCAGAPQAASCSVTPSMVTPSGTGAVKVTVMITTTAHSVVGPTRGPQRILPRPVQRASTLALLVLLVLVVLIGGKSQRRACMALGIVVVLVVLGGAGCAGMMGGTTGGAGTPPGTYKLTVTGISGAGSVAITHSTTVSLTVQ